MCSLGIYFSLAIIVLSLNGFQAKSFDGDFSGSVQKEQPNKLIVRIFPLLDYIAQQCKSNSSDILMEHQEMIERSNGQLAALQKDNEKRLIEMQNQQTDIQKSIAAQCEVQINLEKEQKSLMEAFKNMEEQQTFLHETLGKIPNDFEERLNRMEHQQKSLGAQLESQINLERDQKSLMETLSNIIPENFAERLIKMEERQTFLENILKNIQNDFEVRMERFENETTPILPPGFEKIGSRYFYIEQNYEKDWFGGLYACREKGGYLAAIKNQDEFNAIVVKLRKDNRYWLGINDRKEEGLYISESSGKVASFLKWNPGDPDHRRGTENCVGVAHSGNMADWPCSSAFKFICSLDNTF